MKIRYMLLSGFGKGGTTRTVFNQATSMARAGHEVEIISVLRVAAEPAFPIDDRVKIRWLVEARRGHHEPYCGLNVKLKAKKLVRKALRYRAPARHVPVGEFKHKDFQRGVERKVIRCMREMRDGVLVTTRPALNILSALFTHQSVKTIAQEHVNLGVYKKDVQAACAQYYPRHDVVAVLTEGDREDFHAILPESRVVAIPNAYHEVDDLKLTTYDNHVAVAAGRLYPQKGFDMLIPAAKRAIEKNPDWEIRIFGQGEHRAALQEQINEHELYNNVFLMGYTSNLDDELANASFYVLSSRFEGLPMVMIEAMRHALPVVSLDCPTGPADVITDGRQGLLVRPRDIEALGDAMAEMMADEGLRADMGAAARERAFDFAPEKVHRLWAQLFDSLT